MFIYCGNNPLNRIDISGADSEEFDGDPDLKNETEALTLGPGGDGKSSGGSYYSGGNNAGIQRYEFRSDSELNQHYNQHNGEFGNAFNSPQEYLDAANYVVQNGEYLNHQNAYVKFYGMNGRANYAFVGMSHDRTYITTFHLKHVSKIYFE